MRFDQLLFGPDHIQIGAPSLRILQKGRSVTTRTRITSLVVLMGMSLALVSCARAAEDAGPKPPSVRGNPRDVLNKYYGFVQARDCTQAARLFPNFSRDLCERVRNVEVVIATIPGEEAELSISARYQDPNVRTRLVKAFGNAKLEWVENRWVIRHEPIFASRNPGNAQRPVINAKPGPVILDTHVPPPRSTADEPLLPPAPEKLSAVKPEVVPPVTARPGLPGTVGPSNRSDKVLRKLWTPAQLRAIPEEKRITRLPDALDESTPQASEVLRRDVSTEATPMEGCIRRVDIPADERVVALTFDLCEEATAITGYDGAIIDYLRDHGIAATMFVGGKWMESHPDRAMQLMADP